MGGAGADDDLLLSPARSPGNTWAPRRRRRLGVGLGANALVGGSNKTFVLQPVSVQAQEGLNLAVGFSSFELRRAH